MSDARHDDVRRVTPADSGREPPAARLSDHDGVSRATLRAIIDALAETDQPAMTQCQLAETVDRSATTIRRATTALEADGIVTQLDWGGTKTYYLRHPDSEWPVPPDVDLITDATFEAAADSGWGVLWGDPPLCWRNLGVAAGYLAIMQTAVALLLGALSVTIPVLGGAVVFLEAAVVTVWTGLILVGLVWVRQAG